MSLPTDFRSSACAENTPALPTLNRSPAPSPRKRRPTSSALRAAGYSKDQSKHRSKRLQRHLWLHIEDRIKQRVGDTATLALNTLEELMRNAESENVKLNAARDILSRAGYDATQRRETTIKEVSELSDEELDQQIEKLSSGNVLLFKKEEILNE